MDNKIEGIILNERGTRTLPDNIFNTIGKDIISSFKWRIQYAEQFGDLSDLENPNRVFDGKTLVRRIEEEPDTQWVWGYFQAFPNDLSDDEIIKEPVINLEDRDFINYFYMLPIHLVSDKSILEIESIDGSDTVVRTADKAILDKLKKKYSKWESAEKWYRPNGVINCSTAELTLDERFNFCDSVIKHIDFNEKKNEVKVSIDFSYQAQTWYKKDRDDSDGIGILEITFENVAEYQGKVGDCNLTILKVDRDFDGPYEGEFHFIVKDNDHSKDNSEYCGDIYVNSQSATVKMTPNHIIPKTESAWEINCKGGKSYINGDFKKAFKCYVKAAKMGSDDAMSNLGYCYLYGRSVEPDIDKAIKCFEKAAEYLNVDAVYKLGDIYSSDKWGKKDKKKALKYFHQAANMIDGKSLERFGIHNCWRGYENYPSLCLAIAKLLINDEELEDFETARSFLECAKTGYTYQIERGAEFYKESLKETEKLLNSDELNPIKKRIREVKSIYEFSDIMRELVAQRLSTHHEAYWITENTLENEIELLHNNKKMTYEYYASHAGLAELEQFSEIFDEFDEKMEVEKLIEIVKRRLKEETQKEVNYYDDWFKEK